MTIEQDNSAGTITVECDEIGCDERHHERIPEGETFASVWNRLKDDGWRAKKVPHTSLKNESVWVHWCPACVRAFAADQAADRSPQRRMV